MKLKRHRVRFRHVSALRGNWTFLEVEAGDFVGVAEISHPTLSTELVAEAQALFEHIEGKDPSSANDLLEQLGSSGPTIARSLVIAGFESALFDLRGQKDGFPLSHYFGLRRQERIPLYANLNRVKELDPSPEGFAATAQAALAHGLSAVKFFPYWGQMTSANISSNGRLHPTSRALGNARVRAVRSAIGSESKLLLQLPSYVLCLEEILDIALELEEFDPYLYQLSLFADADENRRFSASVRTPIACAVVYDDRRLSSEDWKRALDTSFIKIAAPDPLWVGGLRRFAEVGRYAESLGIAISPHTPHGPINLATVAQVASTLGSISMAEYAVDNAEARLAVLDPPEHIEDGCLVLSDRSGVGHRIRDKETTATPGPRPQGGAAESVWGLIWERVSQGSKT